MKQIRQYFGRKLALPMIVAAFAQPVQAACTMQTQMTNAQAQEQQRRLNNINTNFQQLQLLNQLQTACLESFPDYPTQYLGNGSVMTTAFNKIKQASCQSLANKARQTSAQAMAAAPAEVQQQINNIEQNVTKATGGSIGMLSGAANQVMPSSSGVLSSITNSLSRLFQ
ncbi:hypothetical protein PQR67_25820 [Paraburkholderia fungorum]|uniref:hypothetical protein n=1 Tax=Paraburkholderia fungorum TaxID=134537 RepID=UPI0038B8E1FE